MIARTTQNMLEKWAGPVAGGDPIAVGAGDSAVVMKWGSLQGVLPAGNHRAMDSDLEVYFVAADPRRYRAGGQAGTHEARPGITVTARAMLEYSLRVADPGRVIAQLASFDGDEPVRQWVNSQLMTAIKSALAHGSVLRALTDSSGVAGAALDQVNGGLRDVGLEVTSIDTLMISVPEDDLAKLR